MAALPANFWPQDIQVRAVKTPLTILRHAAAELAQHTGNILEAQVLTNESSDPDGLDDADDIWLVHSFLIIAPALNRYSRLLFTATHHKMLVYPVTLSEADEPAEGTLCPTQESLVRNVQRILGSDTTRSVLYSLAARIADGEAVVEQ